MSKKAEELAALIVAEMGDIFPSGAPSDLKELGLKYLRNGLQSALELYGRECLEAAAKEVQSHNAPGITWATPIAITIRKMELP